MLGDECIDVCLRQDGHVGEKHVRLFAGHGVTSLADQLLHNIS
jgi:hypothetical protein